MNPPGSKGDALLGPIPYSASLCFILTTPNRKIKRGRPAKRCPKTEDKPWLIKFEVFLLRQRKPPFLCLMLVLPAVTSRAPASRSQTGSNDSGSCIISTAMSPAGLGAEESALQLPPVPRSWLVRPSRDGGGNDTTPKIPPNRVFFFYFRSLSHRCAGPAAGGQNSAPSALLPRGDRNNPKGNTQHVVMKHLTPPHPRASELWSRARGRSCLSGAAPGSAPRASSAGRNQEHLHYPRPVRSLCRDPLSPKIGRAHV